MARPSVRAKLKGRQPSFSPKEDAAIARHLSEGEFPAGEIATMFKTSRASVYRAAARHSKRQSESQAKEESAPTS